MLFQNAKESIEHHCVSKEIERINNHYSVANLLSANNSAIRNVVRMNGKNKLRLV